MYALENITRERFLDLFARREQLTIKGKIVTVQSVQHEDGSGYSYNLWWSSKMYKGQAYVRFNVMPDVCPNRVTCVFVD